MSSGTLTPEAAQGRLNALLAHAPIAAGFVEGDHFLSTSEYFHMLFGWSDDPPAQPLPTRSLFVSDAAHASMNERMRTAFAGGRPLDEEVECVRKDGSRLWARLQASPLAWGAPKGESLWILQDVTAARQQRMQPTWVGRHDPVTELANRREFERRLGEHVGSRRHEPVSMLWIDLDHFRHVVAEAGMEVSNHFLRGLGQMLITKVRASDTVARIEADRFTVLLPDCDQHYAEIVAEKIRWAIFHFRMRWGQHRSRVQASVGVVQLHPSLDTVEAVFDAGAQACAQAKAAGGDTVRVFVHQESPPPAA